MGSGAILGAVAHVIYQFIALFADVLPGQKSVDLLQYSLRQTLHLRPLATWMFDAQEQLHRFGASFVETSEMVPWWIRWALIQLSVSIQVVMLRFTMLLTAIPSALLIFAVVLAEAMLMREKRRLRGGRESGFVYHRLQHIRKLAFWAPMFLWFAHPWNVPAIFAIFMVMPAAFYVWASLVLFKRNV